MSQPRKRYSDLDFSAVAPDTDNLATLVGKLGCALHQRSVVQDLSDTQPWRSEARTHCQHQILIYNTFMIYLCLRIERLLGIPTDSLSKIDVRYARILRFAGVEATIHDYHDIIIELDAMVEA